MAKQEESLQTKLLIVAGNCGVATVVFGLVSLFLGLKMKKYSDLGKEKLADRYEVIFWILIAIAILAFAAFVISMIFYFKKRDKKDTKKKIQPRIVGENKKREVFVVAGAIIKEGYVFAAQRGNKGETKFKWEFPGGKIEPGETPQQALARELEEELKIKVKVYERITNITDEYPTQILHIDTYRCELIEGTPTLTEHINMAWSNKEELDQLEFSPADAPTLAKIKKLYL